MDNTQDETLRNTYNNQPPGQMVGDAANKISGPLTLLRASLSFFKERFRQILGVLAWTTLYAALPLMAVVGLFLLINSLGLSEPLVIILYIALALLALVALIMAIYYGTAGQVALFLIPVSGNGQPAKEIFKHGKSFFWKYVTVGVLVGLFIFGWSLLLIVPGLIMAVYYTFAFQALLYEDYQGKSAIQRSKELVKKYWWPVVGRSLYLAVFFLLINLLLDIPLWFVETGSFFEQAWRVLVEIASYVLAPIAIFYNYFMFQDLQRIKGGSLVEKKTGGKGWLVAVVVIVVIVVGLMLTLSLIALNTARIKARDAQRVADIKQVQTMLEIYQTNNGQYPSRLSDLENGSFMGIPKNPLPSDGDCAVDYDYQYVVGRNYKNYILEFCLGGETAGYPAGINRINGGQ